MDLSSRPKKALGGFREIKQKSFLSNCHRTCANTISTISQTVLLNGFYSVCFSHSKGSQCTLAANCVVYMMNCCPCGTAGRLKVHMERAVTDNNVASAKSSGTFFFMMCNSCTNSCINSMNYSPAGSRERVGFILVRQSSVLSESWTLLHRK